MRRLAEGSRSTGCAGPAEIVGLRLRLPPNQSLEESAPFVRRRLLVRSFDDAPAAFGAGRCGARGLAGRRAASSMNGSSATPVLLRLAEQIGPVGRGGSTVEADPLPQELGRGSRTASVRTCTSIDILERRAGSPWSHPGGSTQPARDLCQRRAAPSSASKWRMAPSAPYPRARPRRRPRRTGGTRGAAARPPPSGLRRRGCTGSPPRRRSDDGQRPGQRPHVRRPTVGKRRGAAVRARRGRGCRARRRAGAASRRSPPATAEARSITSMPPIAGATQQAARGAWRTAWRSTNRFVLRMSARRPSRAGRRCSRRNQLSKVRSSS